MSLRQLGAVAAGACLGTWGRAGLDLLWTHHVGALAASTITVNLLGALLLGVVTGWVRIRPIREHLRLAATTGFCGAFTTYSSLSLVLTAVQVWWGIAQVVGLLLVGTAVAWIGIVLGSRCAALAESRDA